MFNLYDLYSTEVGFTKFIKTNYKFTELICYLYNIFLIALRTLLTPNNANLGAVVNNQLGRNTFIACVFLVTTLLFWLASACTKKKNTKRRLLLAFYFINIVYVFYAYCCILEKKTNQPELGFDLLACSGVDSFYIQTTTLISMSVWIIFIYNVEFTAPLDSYRKPFSAWVLHVYPMLTYIFASVDSRVVVLILCELVVSVFYKQIITKKNHKNLIYGRATQLIILSYFTCTVVAVFIANYYDYFAKLRDTLAVLWLSVHFLRSNRLTERKHPVLLFFFKSVISPLILIIFLRVYTFQTPTVIVCVFLLWLCILFMKSVYEVIGFTPLKAYSRIHKIAMFEDAPEAEIPTQPIEFVAFNSNILSYISLVASTVYVCILSQIVVSSVSWCGLSYLSLLAYSLWGALSFYTATLILHNFKTKSILDFRGVFLAIHQYQWCIKYSYVLFLCLSFLLSLRYFFICYEFVVIQTQPKALLVIFFLSIPVTCYPLWRFLFIWGELVPYWQDYYYTCWSDDYWSHTSPFLRDYIYWKPIPPDDFEEPRPYYFSLQKKATTRYVLMFYYIYIVICSVVVLDVFSGLSSPIKWFVLKTLFFYIVIKAAYYVISVITCGPQNHLYDYTFFEAYSHTVQGFVLFAVVYYFFFFSLDEWDFGILTFLLD